MIARPPGPVLAASQSGSIYDLGYRAYEGPRLGRRHAIRALYGHAVRQAFGLGRGTRAKVVPFGLAFFALLPALVAIAISAFAERFGAAELAEAASPIRYATYYGNVAEILFLFVAAQAPELVGRDQRDGVLALYFSRALRREDYALAKLAGLATALAGLLLVPQALVLAGRTLAARDLGGALLRDLPSVPPAIAQALLAAILLAALGLAVASFTPRRAYATAGIIALFAIPPAVAAIANRASGGPAGPLVALASAPHLLTRTNDALFGRLPEGGVAARLPAEVAIVAAVGLALLAATVLVRRFQLVEA